MEEAGFVAQIINGKTRSPDSVNIADLSTGLSNLVRELNRPDPRDFEPSVQADFVRIRGNLEYLAETKSRLPADVVEEIRSLLTVLDRYRGEGTGGIKRQFLFIADTDLLAIIERDYAELTLKLFPSGAWKSTVIMAGSILEAVLFDQLANHAWHPKAINSPKSKHKKKGTPIPPDDWTLENLIDISMDIGRLPKDPANTIHQVIRDYRNFVHPKKEIRTAHECTEAEGMLSLGALNSVCNYLEKNP